MNTFLNPEDLNPASITAYEQAITQKAADGDTNAALELNFIKALRELNEADNSTLAFAHRLTEWRSYLNESNYERALASCVERKLEEGRKDLINMQKNRRLAYYGYRLGFVNSLLRLRAAIAAFDAAKATRPRSYVKKWDGHFMELTANLPLDQIDGSSFSQSLKLFGFTDSLGDLAKDAIEGRGPSLLQEAYRESNCGLWPNMAHDELFDVIGIDSANVFYLRTAKPKLPLMFIDDSWKTGNKWTKSTAEVFAMYWARMYTYKGRLPQFPIVDTFKKINDLRGAHANLNEQQMRLRRSEILEQPSSDNIERQLAQLESDQLARRTNFVDAYQAVQDDLGTLGMLGEKLNTYKVMHAQHYRLNLDEFSNEIAMYNCFVACTLVARLRVFLSIESGKVQMKYLADQYKAQVEAERDRRSASRGKLVGTMISTLTNGNVPAEEHVLAVQLMRGTQQQ